MNALLQAREDVANALDAEGITAFAKWQPNVKPNTVYVEPASPYVEQGETFGENRIRLDLSVIGPVVTKTTAWEDLDQLVSDVVLALWDLVDVESISVGSLALANNNETYVAATVTVAGFINFKEAI